MAVTRRELIKSAAVGGGGLVVGGVIGKTVLGGGGAAGPAAQPTATGLPQDALAIAKQRNLNPGDIVAALKTYTPSGKLDTHYLFASGGHSGQVWVYGIPSMRILKVIPVFSHSSYQGWGYSDESLEILKRGQVNGKLTTWGDTHHPALSETKGDYDGQFLFINDKAGGRIAVIDLRDFMTKQIVKNPLIIDDHGGTFVTPNTEYVIESCQYSTPLGWSYAPLDEYKDKYRGAVTFWKFDRQKGRIDPAQSWSMELPPYFQDLADSGKLASDGWAFINSFNTEMATGGDAEGKPPMEVGASQRDMDYLHVINWKKAEQVVSEGMVDTVNGMRLIRMDMAVKHGLLYLIPEPKSPHGVDVAPKGDYIVVSGKLDPHVTVYSFKKIQDAIAKGSFDQDSYGLPIIRFDDAMEAQVQLGLGPLHTQFDNQGFGYTSLFLESAVARWSLGAPYRQDGWKLAGKVPIQYNVGHVAAVCGDTVNPLGAYLVSLNKWSLDRFAPTGPHHTVNLQLVDISRPEGMQVLYDVPTPDGEPHYAQIIPADRVKPVLVYPEVGWSAVTWSKDPNATAKGKERVVRNGSKVEVFMTAVRSHYTPDVVSVRQGDTVVWHITNIETARNASHGFALPGYNLGVVTDPGQTLTVTFQADTAGTYPFYCTEFCSALHLEMMGYFLVQA